MAARYEAARRLSDDSDDSDDRSINSIEELEVNILVPEEREKSVST